MLKNIRLCTVKCKISPNFYDSLSFVLLLPFHAKEEMLRVVSRIFVNFDKESVSMEKELK